MHVCSFVQLALRERWTPWIGLCKFADSQPRGTWGRRAPPEGWSDVATAPRAPGYPSASVHSLLGAGGRPVRAPAWVSPGRCRLLGARSGAATVAAAGGGRAGYPSQLERRWLPKCEGGGRGAGYKPRPRNLTDPDDKPAASTEALRLGAI